jgi:KipI family sensor histidine kinase inhibitor
MRGIRPYGPNAFLVEAESIDEVHALAQLRVAGVIQVIPGARTLLVECADVPAAADLYRTCVLQEERPSLQDTTSVIDVVYDGEDLADVARATNLTVDEVVAAHTGAEYRVALCGFTPGFAYISGLPDTLRLPRRATPRERVPAGSVAIAGEWTGVYPRSSPGGWHLLGTTTAVMWDVERDPPALLAPGDGVRFRAV